jgi:hypothetical protein
MLEAGRHDNHPNDTQLNDENATLLIATLIITIEMFHSA